MEVKIEGLRELRADFSETKKVTASAMKKGLQATGLEIVNEAKQNLNHNKTNNTGALRASGKVQKADDGVDAGFFAKDSKAGYAAAVEYGRGPTIKGHKDGEPTLRESLRAWVKRKMGGRAMRSASVFSGMKYDAYIDSITFLIARKIHRKGTKPQPFFVPAVKKIEEKIDDIVSKYINEALK